MQQIIGNRMNSLITQSTCGARPTPIQLKERIGYYGIISLGWDAERTVIPNLLKC